MKVTTRFGHSVPRRRAMGTPGVRGALVLAARGPGGAGRSECVHRSPWRLALLPMFKRSVRFEEHDDSDLAERVLAFAREHVRVGRHPLVPRARHRLAVFRIDDRVPVNTSDDGVFEPIGKGKRRAVSAMVMLLASWTQSNKTTTVSYLRIPGM